MATAKHQDQMSMHDITWRSNAEVKSSTLPLGSLLLKLMIRPEAMPAIANAAAVTMAMFAPGLVTTSLSDPARYNLGCKMAH